MDSKQANTGKTRRSTSNNTKKTKQPKEKKSENKALAIIKSLLILAVFFIVVGLVCAVIIFNGLKANTIDITDSNFWQRQATSLIYDSEGKQIGKLSERDVKWTPICKDLKEGEELADNQKLSLCESNQKAVVSPYYIEALIATEDQDFEEHNGVNFKGMIRVTLTAIARGDTSAGGGSSITMQLAKLLYLDPVTIRDSAQHQVTWTRGDQKVSEYDINSEEKLKYKLSQMALALKIEDSYSKQEIMENYVNTMWFGSGGYGIKNASLYFYGKMPSKLSIDEAATLAGMTQRPVDWDPYTNPEGTTTRRNTVINRLLAEGYITSEEAKEAKAVDISKNLVDHSNDSDENSRRVKYYNDVNLYVLNQLEDLLGESLDLSEGGMKIHTTIDPQLQEATIDTLDTENGLIGMSILEGTETGTAMIDVETGGILAIGNGFDGESPYPYAWHELRNPGSTAKPLVDYAPAIEYLDWATNHTLNDKTTYYSGTSTEVGNYSGKHEGNVTMMYALASSLNTTAVQAFQQVVDEIGLDAMTDWFTNIGLNNWKNGRTEDNPLVYESYALGAFGSTPVEMASAFATFANGGVYNEPHVIDYIEFDENSPYYDVYGAKWYPEYDSHRAMKKSTAYLITKMLNPDNDGAFTKNADVSELDMAIKTGTSNWGENSFGIPESYARDRWTVGYSPDVATAVWYGYEYSYEKQGYMFNTQPEQPLYIFNALMENTINPDNEKLADGEFVMPSTVIEKTVNGVKHYFIKDSDDETNATTAPSAPYINISISSNKVNIDWDDADGASSYNVLVNGEVVKTVNDSKASFTYDELYDTGCESSYELGVQTVGSNGLTSGTSSYSVDNDTSNCGGSDSDKEEDKDTNNEEKEEDKDTAKESNSSNKKKNTDE